VIALPEKRDSDEQERMHRTGLYVKSYLRLCCFARLNVASHITHFLKKLATDNDPSCYNSPTGSGSGFPSNATLF
jgi:hypothetical protein